MASPTRLRGARGETSRFAGHGDSPASRTPSTVSPSRSTPPQRTHSPPTPSTLSHIKLPPHKSLAARRLTLAFCSNGTEYASCGGATPVTLRASAPARRRFGVRSGDPFEIEKREKQRSPCAYFDLGEVGGPPASPCGAPPRGCRRPRLAGRQRISACDFAVSFFSDSGVDRGFDSGWSSEIRAHKRDSRSLCAGALRGAAAQPPPSGYRLSGTNSPRASIGFGERSQVPNSGCEGTGEESEFPGETTESCLQIGTMFIDIRSSSSSPRSTSSVPSPQCLFDQRNNGCSHADQSPLRTLRRRPACSRFATVHGGKLSEANLGSAAVSVPVLAREAEDQHLKNQSKVGNGTGSTCCTTEKEGEIGGGFYGQLWDDLAAPRFPTTPTTPKSVLIWIKKELVDGRSFSLSDCIPTHPRDNLLVPIRRLVLSEGAWNCSPRPLKEQVVERCIMAEKNRGGGGRGRGGGRFWQNNQRPPGQFDPNFQQPFPQFPPYGYGPWQQFPPPFPGPFPAPYPMQWQGPNAPPQGNWQQQMPPPGSVQQNNNRSGNRNQKQAAKQKEQVKAADAVSTKSLDGGSISSVSTGAASSVGEKTEMYAEVICYNCGEPGHHKASCTVPKFCFICDSLEHEVDGCPVKKQPQQVAKFVGSAAPGLGFYHVEIPEGKEGSPATANKNVGVVYIDTGEASKEELYRGLAAIYKTNWPWQIRQLDQWNYLVKFPPHIKVEEVAGYPCFGLPKEGVYVKVHVWNGEMDYLSQLQEVWVQMRGLNPLWCKWKVLMQFVTSFGLLMDVDWIGCSEVSMR